MNDLSEPAELFTVARLIDIFNAVGDSAITVSLACLLRQSLGDHGVLGTKSESIAIRIVAFTMCTGLFTSLCAIMAVVMVSEIFYREAWSFKTRSDHLLDVCFASHIYLHGILLQHKSM